jgi:ubiquinone/menaquinone biosynthesis C-methylase UbiE
MSDHHEHPEIDLSQFYVLPRQEITLPGIDNKGGWILDVGGGGEGIIGLLKGRDVVAIDMLMEELAETTNDALKVVMDAKDLQFIDESFTIATVYFTFMYIPEEDFEVILKELWRVLKPGGEVLIWDVVLRIPPEEQDKDKFVIILKTTFPSGLENETGYGGKLPEQDADSILKPALKVGFKLLEQRIDEYHYFVKLGKP